MIPSCAPTLKLSGAPRMTHTEEMMRAFARRFKCAMSGASHFDIGESTFE